MLSSCSQQLGGHSSLSAESSPVNLQVIIWATFAVMHCFTVICLLLLAHLLKICSVWKLSLLLIPLTVSQLKVSKVSLIADKQAQQI